MKCRKETNYMCYAIEYVSYRSYVMFFNTTFEGAEHKGRM
jgi:hypothetical protein